MRELEDLIIDSIYQGVIQGRIDQRNAQLEVLYTIGRDVQPQELDGMMNTLLSWCGFRSYVGCSYCRYKSTDEALKKMEEVVGYAHSEHALNTAHKQDFAKTVDLLKQDLKLRLEQIDLAARAGMMDEYVICPCMSMLYSSIL